MGAGVRSRTLLIGTILGLNSMESCLWLLTDLIASSEIFIESDKLLSKPI